MNETRASRYHRLHRRAGVVSFSGTVAMLLAALWWRPELPVWAFALLLALLNELVTLPVSWYRGFLLEQRYELSSEPLSAWLRDHVKAFALMCVFAAAAADGLYRLIRWQPEMWWLTASIAATALTTALAALTPILLLPLFFRFTPLDRPALAERLLALSNRAGVRVLGVYEWGLGAKTRRANAALVGTAGTRRILLSDTLLAEYSDDEIEVILAHELAHHVHRDIPKALALEFVLLLAAFGLAHVSLSLAWQPLGFSGPADPQGLPLLVLAAGGVLAAATPLVNAFSRANERRADLFALAMTERSDAFVSAMKRLGSQNLAEEDPSRLTVWLFHSHPPIAERIETGRAFR